MIVGGGEEATDLYTGPFQNVRVLSDDWYSTNLKAIRVGNATPIGARRQGPQGMPSNSIIDSGTNSLNLGQQLLEALISQFSANQQALLNRSISGQLVSADQLALGTWPTITFLLEGYRRATSRSTFPPKLLAGRYRASRRGDGRHYQGTGWARDPRSATDERLLHHL